MLQKPHPATNFETFTGNRGEEKCMQDVGRKIRRKQTTWKT
jgi:hypothetical protein